jgi:MerR family transcriptional regulator, copper efflux regulator
MACQLTMPLILDTLDELAQALARFVATVRGFMPRQLNGYLSVKEAAQYLGVSPATLRNWDRAGKLTPARHPLNDYRLYRQEDLEQILLEAEAVDGSVSRKRQANNAKNEGAER